MAFVALCVAPVTVLAAAGPGITTQPQSQSVVAGSNAVFTVVASGQAPFTYQWSFKGSPLSNSTHIGGATALTLTVSNVTVTDFGNYQVLVSNSHGSITSSNATLTVLVPAGFSSQPANQATYFGGTASFSVSATGTTPLNYQWYLNNAPLSDDGQITGSATAVLTISEAQADDIGNYKVVVTNLYGSATSMAVTLSLTNSTHYVNIAGANPVPPYVSWGTAATNIQDAVDVAYAGDQVIVTNGTYNYGNPINSAANNCVVVTNAISISSVSGPSQTIIDGLGTNRCIYLANGCSLSGFTVTNGGTAAVGAGVFCAGMNVTVSNCVVIGNSTPNQGGGIYQGTVMGCFVANNSAGSYNPAGGGLLNCIATQCILTNNSTVNGFGGGCGQSTLNNCLLVNNSGSGAISSTLNNCTLVGNTGGLGGAAYTSTLSNCTMIANSAGLGGGAGNSTLFNCTLISNSVTDYGGGAYGGTLSNCTLIGNSAPNNDGGGVYQATLYNCNLSGNTAGQFGGGTYGSTLYSCILFSNRASTRGGAAYSSTLYSCTLSNNSAYFGGGAAASTLYNSFLFKNTATYGGGAADSSVLVNSRIISNSALEIGGGVSSYLSTSILTNCVMSGNAAYWGGGTYQSALYNCLVTGNSAGNVGGGADLSTLINCTVTANSAANDGGGVDSSTLTNSIVYSNTSLANGNYSGTNEMSWCCTTPLPNVGADVVFGVNNISSAPVFANAAAGDYRLYPGSPGIDAGNNAVVPVTVDLNGNPRIVNGTVDMGAYEFQNGPFIEIQPSNQVVAVGTTVTLTTLAVGTPSPAYQWYFNGVPLSDNANYSGTGTATLQILNAQISDSGNYFAIATNTLGSATSSVATVTVLLPPAITLQPANQSVLQGSNVTFVAAASGSALSYRWYFDGNALTDGGQFSGSATGNLAVSDVQSTNDGNYMLVVANPLGSATSAVATLTVLLPPSITSALKNETVVLDGTATFSVSATGTAPITYQWQENGVNLTDGGPISGSTTSTLTISNAQLGATGNYTVTASSAYGSASSTATLTVVPLVSWGDDSNGQNIIPAAATNATAIVAGNGFELALKSDGTVIGWGYDADGESSPPPGLTNAVAISASLFLGIALESNQTVAVWGSPDFNETNVPPGLSNVVAVAGGDVFGLALKSDGTVVAWGDDSYGETNIPPGLNNVVAIAADSRTALALKNDGTVVAWGNNEYGETNVPSGLSNVVAIAGGEEFGLALKSNGTVTSWGDSYSGLTIPPSGLSNVVSVTGGEGFGLALKNDTTLTSWGANIGGESGPSNETNVPPGLSNVVSISADLYNSLAMVQNPMVQVPPNIWWQGPTNLIFSTGQGALFKPYVQGSLPMSYQWFFNGAPLSGQTNAWLALSSIQTNQTGNYSFNVSNSYGSATSAVMVVSESPGVLTQPASQLVIVSDTASLSVVAAGPAPLSYQWYFDGSPLADGNGITGSATANLVLSNVQTNEAGLYQCVVTNNYGSATSAAATLSVYPATTIVIQPGTPTVPGGTNVTFTATVTGQAPFSYQWQLNGVNIPGATNTSIALTNVLDSQSGAYSIAVSNVTGTIDSTNAILTVVPWVTALIQPNSAISGFVPIEYSLQSGGFQPNAIYQWQFNGTNLNSSWAWTNSSQTTSFVPYMANAGPYDIVASDSFASETSSVVTLTIDPLVILSQPQPPNQTVVSGTNVTITVYPAGEPTITCQWMFNGTTIPGATNSTLTLTNVTPPQAGNYSVLLTNSYASLVSSNATLSVIPLMITSQPTNQVTWPNGPATFRVNVAGQPPFGFDWQFNGVDIPGIFTNVLALTNVQPSQFGTYDVIISNAWGSVVSTNVTLSLSQIAVWGGTAGEANLPVGLTNVIAVAAGGYVKFDCMALRSSGSAIHWPAANLNPTPTTNLIAIAGGGGTLGQGQPPFLVLERNGTVASWLGDDILNPFLTYSNVVAIAPNDNSLTLGVKANGNVTTGNESTTAVIVSNAVSVAEGQGFYLALKADGTVFAWGINNFNQTNVPPGLSNVVAIAAGYENGLALKSDGSVACWGFSRYTNVPPGLSNVVAIAANEFHYMALLTNGTVVAWGENIYGQTNVPPGLTNVIAIAAGPTFDMALIGNEPPVLSAPLSNPILRTNRFSLSLPSQSGRVYMLQYKNFLMDPAWNSLPLAPGNGGTVILTDPTATNQQRFYRVQRW